MFSLLISNLNAQERSFSISKTNGPITIDGKLNEDSWKKAKINSNFNQTYPTDTLSALSKTDVSVCFDDKNLYIGAVCHDKIEGDFIIQSLKRDYSFPVSDAFAVMLNPSQDKTNGFSFSVNPMGAQREGVLQSGGVYGVTTAWDAKWFSEVSIEKDKWILEMQIPLASIRFTEKDTLWGINFIRNDLKRNETSSWSRVPQNFNVGNLSFTGKMKWETPPKKVGLNYALIPSIAGGAQWDYLNDENRKVLNLGLDIKLAVTSSLNLDLTVNPDFSQVEIDQAQINLTEYSLYYPERRKFFIENSDLFDQFGFRQIRPFYSRRIGLEKGMNIPIVGARLSGKIDQNWRIGYMSVGSAGSNFDNLDDLIAPKTFTVAAVQRKLFKASNIGLIYVQKDAYDANFNFDSRTHNQVIGIDYNLASKDRRWIGNMIFHTSIPIKTQKNAYTHASFLRYTKRNIELEWNHEYVGNNYNPEVGFVPKLYNRDDSLLISHKRTFWRLEPAAKYTFYPKNSKIHNHGLSWRVDQYMDSLYTTTSRINNVMYFFNFLNKGHLEFRFKNSYKFLRYPINITRVSGDPLFKGKYVFNELGTYYGTNSRKSIYGAANLDYGDFYIAKKLTLGASLSYRHQPMGTFSIVTTYHNIKYPSPYGNTLLMLIGPKAVLSFTKKLFFTGLVQFDTQNENLSLFSKIQYRFAPMSDLYIVYSDQYDIHLNKKNRVILFKFVYWLSK